MATSQYRPGRKGLYSILTTYIIVVTLLAAVAALFLVNRSMLKINEEKSFNLRKNVEMGFIKDRMYYCYGTVIDERHLLENLDCLELKDGQGLAIERLPYGSCPTGPVKELNYKGYGRVVRYDIPMYDLARDRVCPAQLSIYEHAVVVPLILSVTSDPLIAVQGEEISALVRFYHTVFPSYLNISVRGHGRDALWFDSGPLGEGTESLQLQIDSALLEPGLYTLVTYATHDHEFIDVQSSGRFRVVDPLDVPVLEWFRLWPNEGTFRDSFNVWVNISDYVDIDWVTIIIENESGVVDFFNLTRTSEFFDMELLVRNFIYEGAISGARLGNSNATYTVSLAAANVLGNIARFDDLGTITITEISGLDVAIVAVRGLLQQVYSEQDIASLEDSMEDYTAAIAESGLLATFLYLDSDEVAQMAGSRLSGGPPYSYSQIDSIIEQLHEAVNFSYMILVGGHRTFPHAEAGPGLDLARLHTDDVYADMDGDMLADIALGRIIEPTNGDMPFLLRTLDNTIAAHRAGGVDLSVFHTDGMNYEWTSMTCFNQQAFGDANHPNTHFMNFDCARLTDAHDKGFYAVLLHGSDRPQEFACNFNAECSCGWGGGTRPGDIAALRLGGAVWMTMPCLGGKISNKRTVSESIPMSFHSAGGLVYIGSTDSNLGDADGCYNIRGVLVGDFYVGALYVLMTEYFETGARLGDAYLMGKRDYDMYVTRDPADLHDFQLHINCYYGDPTLKIRGMWR